MHLRAWLTAFQHPAGLAVAVGLNLAFVYLRSMRYRAERNSNRGPLKADSANAGTGLALVRRKDLVGAHKQYPEE